jgi:ADP-ribosylglycohydrolase
MDAQMNHAFGCFLGLLCGDAAGATLEFKRGIITPIDVKKAMEMPGGGQLCVGPGQFTDDSELAIALADALLMHSPLDGFPLDAVAQNYHIWYTSIPFDMGLTCGRAFAQKNAKRMLEMANIHSEANGALMRIAPLALWCFREPTETIAKYAKTDALLSHPSPVCQDCNAVFCIAIVYLITHPGDHVGVLQHLDQYVRDNVHSMVRKWFLEDSLDVSNMDCTVQIGHVRYAFTLAIWCLRNAMSYESAIEYTLSCGGDTDTNGAIVGALIGALHGADAIPKYMLNPVLEFDSTVADTGHMRPTLYNALHVMKIIPLLMKKV